MRSSPERTRLQVLWPAAALLASMFLAACSTGDTADSPGSTDDALVRYTRVSEDGFSEEQSIAPDGRVLMKHGDTIERFTLAADDMEMIREALERDIPTGSPDDRPQRRLILGDGTVIEAPRPDPGTITELMDRLMDRHSFG